MLLSDFVRLSPEVRAYAVEGLAAAIDPVAADAPETHRFLRYQWFAGALAAYGGQARTIIVEGEGAPAIALPICAFGPGRAKLAAVPGYARPFRGFPARADASLAEYAALVEQLGHEVNALRIGPASKGDATLAPLLDAARAKGWAVLDCDNTAAVDTEAEDEMFRRIASSDPMLAAMEPWSIPSGSDARTWLMLRPGVPATLGRMLLGVWSRT